MKMDKRKIFVIICSVTGAALTWYLNHQLGVGTIVSNGLVGLTAALILPAPLAGIAYTASFVGMSSTSVIPSVYWALAGGLVVSLVVLTTAEVYAGIGGKGGTTAALSTLITRAVLSLIS
jgi:hypothetical protein